MALPDVPDTYRLTFRQSFNGNEVLNVFHYRDVAANPVDPFEISEGWWNHVKAAWRAWQVTSSSILNVEVVTEALFGDHAFGVYSIPVAEQQGLRGSGTSQFLAPFNAAAITLRVATRVTRPGSKRIVGLLESDVNNLVLEAAALTLIQNIANVWDDAVTPTGEAFQVVPVIVGYPTALQPGNPRVQDVTQAVASQYVSHQVSRDARP